MVRKIAPEILDKVAACPVPSESEDRLLALEKRVAELERRLTAGAYDADRPIEGIRAIAGAIDLSPSSLRKWVRKLDDVKKRRLNVLLLRKSPSGRWCTSPRLIQHRRQTYFTDPWALPLSREERRARRW
jgi:hypothetical protein